MSQKDTDIYFIDKHDPAWKIWQMTIGYEFAHTQFGRVLLMTTENRLCFLGFCFGKTGESLSDSEALMRAKTYYPGANLYRNPQAGRFAAQIAKTGKMPPMLAIGTDFQRKVWQALCDIPRNSPCSYKDIAKKIDKPKAMRAVGNANGRNPIAYFIPCHRVLDAGGGIGGYGYGIACKKQILKFERDSP